MTRIAVTADLHCDDFGSKVDPETGLNARWVDAVDMVRWVAEDARQRKADVFVVAGDFTEHRHPAPWRVALIAEALDAFPGPKVYVRGNHDGQRADRSIVELLEGSDPSRARGFSAPGRLGLSTDLGYSNHGAMILTDPDASTAQLAIAVMPYLDSHWLRAQAGYENVADAELLHVLAEQYLVVTAGLRAEITAADPEVPAVLVVHQALSGGLMSDTQQAFLGDHSLVVDSRALAAQGWDAALAGHFHRHQVLSTEPLVAYAGAPYRTDFGEEHQAKGYLVVDVDEAGVRWEFVETPARRFVTLTGEIDPTRDAVDGAVVRVIDLPPEADAGYVRTFLEELGAWDVQEIRRRPGVPSEVAGGLSESLTATEALVEYFAGDPDRDALVDRGRSVLAEVGS